MFTKYPGDAARLWVTGVDTVEAPTETAADPSLSEVAKGPDFLSLRQPAPDMDPKQSLGSVLVETQAGWGK